MNVVRKSALPAFRDVEAFLAWEDGQEGRYEFDGERVIPMTGGSLAHQWLVISLANAVMRQLDRSRFVVAPEMRLRIGNKLRYPDLTILAAPVPLDARTLTDAIIGFEVVSKSTARIDRGDKVLDYTAVPSLRRYVLLEQTQPAATVFSRTDAGQTLEQVASLTAGQALSLPEVGVEINLDEIFAAISS